MRSFWRQRMANSGVLEVHFFDPLPMYHKGRYVTIFERNRGQQNCEFPNYLGAFFSTIFGVTESCRLISDGERLGDPAPMRQIS
jgi:hypothetical protein